MRLVTHGVIVIVIAFAGATLRADQLPQAPDVPRKSNAPESGQTQVVFSNGWELPPGDGATPAAQCDGDDIETCDPFAIRADDFQSTPGSLITNVDVRGTFFGPAGAIGDIAGFLVVFYLDVHGLPSDHCHETFVATTFHCSGTPENYDCFIRLPNGGYTTPADRGWVSITPIMPFPPQWGWRPTDFVFGSFAQGEFNAAGDVPLCDTAAFIEVRRNLTFRLRTYTPPTGRQDQAPLDCPPGLACNPDQAP